MYTLSFNCVNVCGIIATLSWKLFFKKRHMHDLWNLRNDWRSHFCFSFVFSFLYTQQRKCVAFSNQTYPWFRWAKALIFHNDTFLSYTSQGKMNPWNITLQTARKTVPLEWNMAPVSILCLNFWFYFCSSIISDTLIGFRFLNRSFNNSLLFLWI